MKSFRRLYGAGPAHLLGGVASLVVVAVALSGWFDEPAISLKYILIWFAGAILAHDMLVLPLYTALDQLSRLGGRPTAGRPRRATAGWAYVRVPVLLSALLLLVFGAEIFGWGDHTFHVASGSNQHVYLGRYLAIVATLFAASALAFAVSRLGARSKPDPAVRHDSGDGPEQPTH